MGTVLSVTSPDYYSVENQKKKACCACPETKKTRDQW